MKSPAIMLLFAAVTSAELTADHCMDPAGQHKRLANDPTMYYWHVHDTDMLMQCPPTTVWFQDECMCMTIDEIAEENPSDMDTFRRDMEAAIENAANARPVEFGIDYAVQKLALNFDKGQLTDDSPNRAYIQRRKNVRVTRRSEGVNGNAAKFRSGYLKVPMFNNFLWGSEMFVSMWIKPDVSEDGFYGILDNAAVGCISTSSLFVEIGKQSPTVVELIVGLRTHQQLITMATYLPLQMMNNWVHVAIVYDGETAETYIDGKVRAKDRLYGDVLARNCPLTIGYSRGLRQTNKYRGLIDQIVLMKYVPTKQEIRELYMSRRVL